MPPQSTVVVAQLVRALDCGSRGRGFEPHLPPNKTSPFKVGFFDSMYFVYILYSETGNRYYIGQTNNIEDRLIRHNNGYEKSTAPYKPWKLVLMLEKETRSEALILEKKIKNLNTKDLLKFIEKYKH